MFYRGFYISSCEDSGIERTNPHTGKEEICNGYYCQVYADSKYNYQIDDFCLAVGYEIPDLNFYEEGIKQYIDFGYEALIKAAKEYKTKIQQEENKATDIITAEDIAEQAFYAATAPECCSKEERAKNMLGMLGANISDETIYHDESEHDYKTVVSKSVEEEFEAFKNALLTNHTLEDVFYSAFEIYVKTELSETIQDRNNEEFLGGEIYKALHRECGSILENLCVDFIGEAEASIDHYADTARFIEGYCERNYPEILNESAESNSEGSYLNLKLKM